jgi:long-chain acyl-CoA synthetase
MSDNIAALLQAQFAGPARTLYRQHIDGAWRDFGARDIALLAARWQQAFRREGLVAGERVAICLRNGVNWVAIDQAALAMRLVVVPLYVDDNAENIAWCLAHSGARLLLLENGRMLEALRQCGAQLPLTVLAGVDKAAEKASGDQAGVPGIAAFLPAAVGEFTVAECAPDTLATICYTSGTSGRPKGVMLSHGNILANVRAILQLDIARSDDVFLSFLPLSHMFERTPGYYLPLAVGAKVTYARSVAQLAEDLVSEKPTVIFAVPRVFEKFHTRIHEALAASRLKRALFERVVTAGWRAQRGVAGPLDRLVLALLRNRIAAPILARLGGRLRLAVIGGAPLEGHVARTFIGLGLCVLQGYGMTESAPVISVNLPQNNDPDSVGPPLPGTEVRLGPGNELLARGASVMSGYWDNAEASARSIDGEGWLHTGDLAELKDGRVYIRGRIKDVLVLSNGEKLPPQDVELAILSDEVFEQGMLVGEGRSFLTFIAVSKQTDEKALVRRANDRLKSFPRYIRVRRVIITNEPWSVDNGLMTPTMKVKRTQVLARFEQAIARVYADSGAQAGG